MLNGVINKDSLIKSLKNIITNNFDSELSRFNSSNFISPIVNATTNPILNKAAIPKHHFDLYYDMKTHIQLLVNKLMSIIEPLTLISLGFLKIVFSGGTKEIFISSDRLEEFKGNFQIIKSHKKQGFTPSLERTVLEKPQVGGGEGGSN